MTGYLVVLRGTDEDIPLSLHETKKKAFAAARRAAKDWRAALKTARKGLNEDMWPDFGTASHITIVAFEDSKPVGSYPEIEFPGGWVANMMKQIAEEKHLVVRLWSEIQVFPHAAAGLLRDVIGAISRRQDGTDGRQDASDPDGIEAWFQEAVMEILDDQDGTKLRDWVRLFRDDPAGFDEQARRWVKEASDRRKSDL